MDFLSLNGGRNTCKFCAWNLMDELLQLLQLFVFRPIFHSEFPANFLFSFFF